MSYALDGAMDLEEPTMDIPAPPVVALESTVQGTKRYQDRRSSPNSYQLTAIATCSKASQSMIARQALDSMARLNGSTNWMSITLSHFSTS